MARILVVDDEHAVADMVARALRNEEFETLVAYNPLDALQIAQKEKPDLIILDVMMPGMSGLEVCRRIRQTEGMSDVPVIFLTARDQVEHKVQGFDVGADDYVTKPFDLRELLGRIRAVLRRTQPRQVTELTAGAIRLNTETKEVYVNDELRYLTPVEFSLLEFLMRNQGKVFSTEDLLQNVWGYPSGTGSPDLVRVHIRNLRLKIEEDPRNPTYIQTVGHHGYTLKPGKPSSAKQKET